MVNRNFKEANYNRGGRIDFSKLRKANPTTNNNEAVKREKSKIQISTIPFDSDVNTKKMTSMELSSIIYDIMSNVFDDFEGCIIKRDEQYGNPYLLMYFKERNILSKDKFHAIERINADNRDNTQNATDRYLSSMRQRKVRSKQYKLSNSGMDILETMMKRFGNAPINWNQCISEVSENAYQYRQYTSVLVEVRGFDLGKILKLIYGQEIEIKDDEGKTSKSRVMYSIGIIRPLTTMNWNNSNLDTNFLLTITQLNVNNVEELGKKLGAVPCSGSIPMFRR